MYGHFVLLRLDPVASVAPLADEESSRAAALLPRDWFLAIVMSNGSAHLFNSKGKAKLNFKFCLVGIGAPKAGEASVPIESSKKIDDAHPPIPLTAPLRWQDLYVHTFHCVAAVVSRIHHGTGKFPASLSKEQHHELDTTAIGDGYDAEDIRARQLLEASAKRAAQDDSGDVDEDSATDEEDEYDRNSSEEEEYHLTDEMRDMFEDLFLHVELWTDPAACPHQPTDPSKLAEHAASIKAIWRTWRTRTAREAMAKHPQTSDWIQAVHSADMDPDEATSPRPSVDLPLDDNAIAPDDSVDRRFEREAEDAVANAELHEPPPAVDHDHVDPPLPVPLEAKTSSKGQGSSSMRITAVGKALAALQNRISSFQTIFSRLKLRDGHLRDKNFEVKTSAS